MSDNYEVVPTAPASVSPVPSQPLPVSEYDPLAHGPRYWSNVDDKSDEGKYLIMKAHSDPDVQGGVRFDQTFPTKYLLCHGVQIADIKTGEVQNYVRVVLIDPDGRTMAFVSDGVAGSIGMLVTLYGKGPWDPPLRIVPKTKKTRSGFQTIVLDLEKPQLTGRNAKGVKRD